MKRPLILASLLLSLAVTSGCHNGGGPGPDGDPTSTPTPPDTSRIQFCPDGTLNCYVTFPEGGNTTNVYINNPIFNYGQTFEQCIDKCMPAYCTDGDGDIVAEAAEECPGKFEECEAKCNLTSNESPLQDLPDSDQLVIPENPKVVLVEITGCFDWGTTEELHFQGPNVYFHRENNGRLKVRKSGTWPWNNYKYVDLNYSVGLHDGCPAELKKKLQVTYQPLGASSLTIGEGSSSTTIPTIPFTNTMTIDRTYKIPHSVPFGIPASIRDEIELTEVAWMPKEFGTITPSGVEAINDFRFYSNDIPYGQSVIFLSYLGGGNPRAKQTITMYGFFKSKAE